MPKQERSTYQQKQARWAHHRRRSVSPKEKIATESFPPKSLEPEPSLKVSRNSVRRTFGGRQQKPTSSGSVEVPSNIQISEMLKTLGQSVYALEKGFRALQEHNARLETRIAALELGRTTDRKTPADDICSVQPNSVKACRINRVVEARVTDEPRHSLTRSTDSVKETQDLDFSSDEISGVSDADEPDAPGISEELLARGSTVSNAPPEESDSDESNASESDDRRAAKDQLNKFLNMFARKAIQQETSDRKTSETSRQPTDVVVSPNVIEPVPESVRAPDPIRAPNPAPDPIRAPNPAPDPIRAPVSDAHDAHDAQEDVHIPIRKSATVAPPPEQDDAESHHNSPIKPQKIRLQFKKKDI